jgi:pimeloyl-ACP methyl ester carboxylesterase
MAGVERFSIPCSQDAVDDLRGRLGRIRWPDAPGPAWEYGIDREFLREICEYWRDGFDWPAQVERLAEFPHYRCVVEDVGIHFIHARGTGPERLPLIVTHGWPGSFVEMLRLIPLLTDEFDLVVPSMPGYGYSDRPGPGINTWRIAELWTGLMTALGYERFAAQGGDLGAAVSTILGLRHPERTIGVHLNYIPGSYWPHIGRGPLSAEEERFVRERDAWADREGAYSHVQRTRPLTAAYGLNDSPVGLAAWILEKFREWADCDGDVYRRFSRDDLLTNLTVYWMTETIGSSFRLYFEGARAPLRFGPEDYVKVPCAVARFRKRHRFRQGSGSSEGTTCSAGPRCLAAAISQPRRSRNCWRRMCGRSFEGCESDYQARRRSISAVSISVCGRMAASS